ARARNPLRRRVARPRHRRALRVAGARLDPRSMGVARARYGSPLGCRHDVPLHGRVQAAALGVGETGDKAARKGGVKRRRALTMTSSILPMHRMFVVAALSALGAGCDRDVEVGGDSSSGEGGGAWSSSSSSSATATGGEGPATSSTTGIGGGASLSTDHVGF